MCSMCLKFQRSPSPPPTTLAPFLDEEPSQELVNLSIRTSSVDAVIAVIERTSTSGSIDRVAKDGRMNRPVSEHSEPEIPDLLSRKHVQHMCTI